MPRCRRSSPAGVGAGVGAGVDGVDRVLATGDDLIVDGERGRLANLETDGAVGADGEVSSRADDAFRPEHGHLDLRADDRILQQATDELVLRRVRADVLPVPLEPREWRTDTLPDGTSSVAYTGDAVCLEIKIEKWGLILPEHLEDACKRAGIKPEELSFVCAGLNHLSWFIQLEHRGKDLTPKLRKVLSTNQDISENMTRACSQSTSEVSSHQVRA